MAKDQTKKRKQDLGIFYTPQEVVNFIFDILNIWKEKEDRERKRWNSNKPPHHPSAIDPACGEGIFLKRAIDSKFTEPDWIFGIDLDEKVTQKWEEISLLKTFKNDKEKMWSHLFHQNGLEKIKWNQHKNKYYGKLKKEDIKNEQFDCVVGNPPYGGLGIYEEMKQLLQAVYQTQKVTSIENQVTNNLFGEEEVKQIKVTKNIESKIDISPFRLDQLKDLSKSLLEYLIWKDSKLFVRRTDYLAKINGLDFNLKYLLDTKEIDRLKSFPIEILFAERFIQLAKPGGWIAIIIPDGILTNSNSHYVREFISNRAKVEAIVSLPRETFKNAGTSAKTSILFLRKLKQGDKPENNYPIFLASVEKVKEGSFDEIVKSYEKFYNSNSGSIISSVNSENNHMDKSNLIQTTKDQNKREAVMVRVDKTIKEISENKPASRWDPDYWHPKYEKVLSKISPNYKLVCLKELLKEPIIAPDHVRASKGEKIGPNFTCEYRTLKDLMFTGLNYAEINYCSDNAFNRLRRSQLKKNDILFAGSGIGAIGRVGIVLEISDKSCVGDLFIIRNSQLNPFYLYVYLLTIFGQSQIERVFHGIQSAKISTEEIATILIPILPDSIQNVIETKYKEMFSLHQQAMDAHRKHDTNIYENKIKIAENILKDLIKITEEVIEGKREDVN